MLKYPSEVAADWAKNHKLKYHFAPEIDSTNAFAKKNLGLDFVAANHQSAGRGRFDRHWNDLSEGQLLATWTIRKSGRASPALAPRLGLGLLNACRSTWTAPSCEWSLKAPNDLYLGASKIAGLLTEVTSQDSDCTIHIGLGMNLTKAPDVGFAGSLSHFFPEQNLSLISFHRFLTRWFLELNLAVENKSEELEPDEITSLTTALRQNPFEPKVLALRPSGVLLWNDGTEKKWIDL